ncbi:MAG: NADH-quinone oxidoreductase subunit J [Chloroflexi bacterium]|nr:NADH-quinone oxidoreductase subunit J [Chloroflexota bacterium]
MLIPEGALIAVTFYVLGVLAIAGGVGLILARRIFHSALFLVLTLVSVAGVFVILGADFLAAVQVLVYVGAITVLLLFGIMLTPQTVQLPDIASPGQAISGALVAAALFVVTVAVVATTAWPRAAPLPLADQPTTNTIAFNLFNTYVLPFEIASILLLVAMIGAIVIAREE